MRLYVRSYAFIARIPFIKWEAFLTSVERYRTGLAYQILAIVPYKENKRLYSIDGNANPPLLARRLFLPTYFLHYTSR